MKKRIRLFMIPLILALLSSCTLLDKLGFDTYDYMGESVLRSLPADGEESVLLTDLLSMLITDSDTLPTFTNMGDAIREYRDTVLTYMLSVGYLQYSANTALIEKTERAYPEYHITQVIPESEFESVMYRIFGGDVKITHKDGERFQYLSRVGVYVTPHHRDPGDGAHLPGPVPRRVEGGRRRHVPRILRPRHQAGGRHPLHQKAPCRLGGVGKENRLLPSRRKR